MIKNKNIRLASLYYKKLLFIFCLIPVRKSFGDVINHSSSERRDIFVPRWSRLSHVMVVLHCLHGWALPRSWLDNAIRFGTFPGCKGSYGMVTNGPASSFVSFNIHQGLKCYDVASIPTLTMWLLRSHRRPQGLNMFSSQQVFRSGHDKESLVLLHAKNPLGQKLIKTLETRVLRSKLVCSHTFPKTSSDN